MIRVHHGRPRSAAARQGLARDTALILGSALAAILLSRLLVGGGSVVATASPTPVSSFEVIGDGGTPVNYTLPPLTTLGPVVNPTVGFGATPTPVPFITLGPPTPTPAAAASASVKPTAAPKPTKTPAPIVVASFSCARSVGWVLTCTDQSTNATSWLWDWGDGTTTTGKVPPPHTYASTYSSVIVTLTIKPSGFNSSESIEFILIPAAATATP
jgi:hypothetical protein